MARRVFHLALASLATALVIGCDPGGSDDARGPDSLAEAPSEPSRTLAAVPGPAHDRRHLHTATMLNDGRVLVVGGFGEGFVPLASAEVYDPVTGVWSQIGSMVQPRAEHAASLLGDGRLLVTGGRDEVFVPLASAEVYDPSTGLWSPYTDMAAQRRSHSAVVLRDGTVFVVGGNGRSRTLASVETFDPSTTAGTVIAPMRDEHGSHRVVVLSNGRVLVAGGVRMTNENMVAVGAELYDPASAAWTDTGSMSRRTYAHSLTLLADGRAHKAGGFSAASRENAADIKNPPKNNWT